MGHKELRKMVPAYSILGKMTALAAMKQCPICTKPVKLKDFTDVLSRKEFKISGMCQKCQDQTFGAMEE